MSIGWKKNKIIDAGIRLLWKYFSYILMRTFWYYVNIYKTSYREVYHVAENIIPNKVLLSYQVVLYDLLVYGIKLPVIHIA